MRRELRKNCPNSCDCPFLNWLSQDNKVQVTLGSLTFQPSNKVLRQNIALPAMLMKSPYLKNLQKRTVWTCLE